MARIYVASSWRNERQPEIVAALRFAGHEVYDFRNPGDGETGFHWSEIDPNWQQWTPQQFRSALARSRLVDAGYTKDLNAMRWADACMLVLPSGRSAHLEAGWFVGQGKRAFVFLADGEPELMYRMFSGHCCTIDEVLSACSTVASKGHDSAGPGPPQ